MAKAARRKTSNHWHPVACEIQVLEPRILLAGPSDAPEVVHEYHVSDGEGVTSLDRRELRSLDIALEAHSIYTDARSSRTEVIEAQAGVTVTGHVSGRVDKFIVTAETNLVASEATGAGFRAEGTLREATTTVVISGSGQLFLQVEAHASTSRSFELRFGDWYHEEQLESERAKAYHLFRGNGPYSFSLTISARGEVIEYGGSGLATHGRVQRDTASVWLDAHATRFVAGGHSETGVTDLLEYRSSHEMVTVSSHALSMAEYLAHGSGPFSISAGAEEVRVLAYATGTWQFVREVHYAGTASIEPGERGRSMATLEAGAWYDGENRHSWLYFDSLWHRPTTSNTYSLGYSAGDPMLLDPVFSDADLVAYILFGEVL